MSGDIAGLVSSVWYLSTSAIPGATYAPIGSITYHSCGFASGLVYISYSKRQCRANVRQSTSLRIGQLKIGVFNQRY